MESVWVLVIGIICFILYKMNEQNNRMEQLKLQLRMQALSNNDSHAETQHVPSEQTIVDPVDSGSDDELNSLLELAARSAGITSPVPRIKSNGKKINVVQNITGPQNNNNVNCSLGFHMHPSVDGMGGGYRFLGSALSAGIGSFLNGPPRPSPLPAAEVYELKE